MADLKLSQLPELDTATGEILLYAVSGGQMFKIKGETLAQDLAGQTVDKEALELDQVDNTHDLDKPISNLTQAALDLKADITALDDKADQAALESLSTQLDGKANTVHTHVISDVTGLQDALDDTVNQEAFAQQLATKADQSVVVGIESRVVALEEADPSVGGVTEEQLNQALLTKADVSALEATDLVVADKADQASLNTLADRVTVLETAPFEGVTQQELTDAVSPKANQTDLEALEQVVEGLQTGSGFVTQQELTDGLAVKLDSTDAVDIYETRANVATLATRVQDLEDAPATGVTQQYVDDGLATKADQSALTALDGVVGTKANQSDLEALEEVVAGLETGGGVTQQYVDDGLALKVNIDEWTDVNNVIGTQLTAFELSLGNFDEAKADKTDLTAAEARIQALEDAPATGVTQQYVDDGLALKADQTDLTAAEARIQALEDAPPSGVTQQYVDDGLALKANQADFEALEGTVASLDSATSEQLSGKADVEALNAVAERVTDLEAIPAGASVEYVDNGLATKANQSDLTTLATTVAGKAEASDVADALATKADTDALAAVAISGLYNDLIDAPTALEVGFEGIVYVSLDGSDDPSDYPDGSISKPYRTIQTALNAAAVGSIITILPGVYSEHITVVKSVLITSMDTTDVGNTIIKGKATVDSDATIGFSNLAFDNTSGDSEDLVMQIGNSGGVRIKNCRFTNNTNQPLITIDGSGEGVIFDNVSGTGYVDVQGGRPIRFLNIADPDFSVQISTTYTAGVAIDSSAEFGWVYHGNGILFINNVGRLAGIESESALPLLVNNTNVYYVDSSARVLMSPTTPYVFNNVTYKEDESTLGTRLRFNANAKHLGAGFGPTNYTPVDGSVTEHLRAIDAELAGIASGGTAPIGKILYVSQNNDNPTSGSGTQADPFTSIQWALTYANEEMADTDFVVIKLAPGRYPSTDVMRPRTFICGEEGFGFSTRIDDLGFYISEDVGGVYQTTVGVFNVSLAGQVRGALHINGTVPAKVIIQDVYAYTQVPNLPGIVIDNSLSGSPSYVYMNRVEVKTASGVGVNVANCNGYMTDVYSDAGTALSLDWAGGWVVVNAVSLESSGNYVTYFHDATVISTHGFTIRNHGSNQNGVRLFGNAKLTYATGIFTIPGNGWAITGESSNVVEYGQNVFMSLGSPVTRSVNGVVATKTSDDFTVI